jgi:uracil-DNA glycosylase
MMMMMMMTFIPGRSTCVLITLGGETSTIIESRHDSNRIRNRFKRWETKEYYHMPFEHPSDLVGKTSRWIHRRMIDAVSCLEQLKTMMGGDG